MITPKRKLCTCYSEEKCCACIGYLEQMVEKNWLLRKTCGFFRRFLHVNLKTKLPYMYQKVTIARFEKMKCLLENAALLLPVSRRTKEIYENSSIVNKYEILYIGNIHADQYTENYVLSPLNIDSKIHIAMVGELSYMKGAEIFIKIAKTIDKNKYVMHFYGKSQKEYEKVAQASGVIMHGKYKQSEMKEILRKVDIGLVLPVCEDAGPQVVMELLNNHIPVVTTRMGGIPDFVDEKNGFLFNPYNDAEIMSVINFFDKLNFEKINFFKKNITRTTTTQEHYLDLSKVYQKLLKN